jgi:hypothetical protein
MIIKRLTTPFGRVRLAAMALGLLVLLTDHRSMEFAANVTPQIAQGWSALCATFANFPTTNKNEKTDQ